MKKNNKVLALCMLLVSTLVACNSKNSSSKEESSKNSSSSSSVVKESTITSSSTSESTSSEVSSSSSSSSSSTSSSSSSSTSNSSTNVEVVLDDVKEKIAVGLENLSKVKSGTLTYNEGSDVVTTYEYGVDNYGDFIHINEKGKIDKYYGYNKNKEVYGIQVANETMRIPLGTISEVCLNGPYISPFGYVEQDKMFGVKGVMGEILNSINEDKNKDFLNMSTSSIGYKFSYGKVVQEARTYLWVNTISFDLEGDTFKSIECTFKKYSSVTADFENDGVYFLNDNAKPNKTITAKFEQVIGEKDAVNPHDIESYYISSFDLKDEKGNKVEDIVSMNADTPKELTVENLLPETASSAIDTITVSEPTGKVKGTYKASTGVVTLTSSTEGDYEVTFKTKNTTKVVNVHVDKAIPSSLTIMYYVECGEEYTVDLLYDEKDTITTYVGSDIYLRPSFSPSKADQSNILEVTSDNKESLVIENAQIISGVGDNTIDVYKLNASEKGIYNLKVTSSLDASVTKNFKFEVLEAPVFEDIFESRYVRTTKGNIYIDLNFFPNENNKKEGKVEVNDVNAGSSDNGTYSYVYNDATKEFSLTKLDENGNALEDEVNVKLEYSANYDLVYTRGTSSQIVDVFSHELMVSRIEWQGRDSGGGWTSFSFKVDGTGQFSYYKSDENFETIASYKCEIKYEVEEVNGELYIKINQKSLTEIYKSKIVTEMETINLASDYKSFTLTLTIDNIEETLTFRHGG